MMSSLQLSESLLLWRYWFFKAKLGFKLKYRGSSLGAIWPALSIFVVVAVIGAVWGVLLEKDNLPQYYLYLLVGYSVWTVLAGAVEQGCREIAGKLAGGIPFYTLILERIVLTILPFLIICPVVLLTSLYMLTPDGYFFVTVLFSFLLLIVWTAGLVSFLIVLTALIPDLRHLINAMMRLAFLATPIIWDVERLGAYKQYIWFNPFYIPLETFRQSLLNQVSHDLILYFSIYALVMLLIGSLLLKIKMRDLVK